MFIIADGCADIPDNDNMISQRSGDTSVLTCRRGLNKNRRDQEKGWRGPRWHVTCRRDHWLGEHKHNCSLLAADENAASGL